ncbi:MAG: hypothetical protein U0166_24700 [Acidobacteriota bacterium]
MRTWVASALMVTATWPVVANQWVMGPPFGTGGASGISMAYDSRRGRVVLYAGCYRTLEFDGANWSAGPNFCNAYGEHTMTFFPTRARMVLASDEWDLFAEYDGTTWVEGANPLGGDLLWQASAYDGIGDRVIVCGGARGGGNDPDAQAVAYDGTSWSRVASLRTTLAGHAMVHDSRRNVVVLYGGYDITGTTQDRVDEFDGTSWIPRPRPPPGLGARYWHAMAFDPGLGKTVVFGGYGAPADTWTYDGTTWSVEPPPPPLLTPRWLHAMAYSAEAGGVVLAGGDDGALRNDTWIFGAAAPSTSRRRSCRRHSWERLTRRR